MEKYQLWISENIYIDVDCVIVLTKREIVAKQNKRKGETSNLTFPPSYL
jgi:hypothetical protein